MTSRTAAKRYARALFDVALKEQADLVTIDQQLAAFVGLIGSHPTLEKVLLNPAVPGPRKGGAIAELAARVHLGSSLGKLMVLLAERDRLILLPDIVKAFRDRLMDYEQVVRAEVTTAAPLSAARTQGIERSLAQVTGRRVALSTRVDSAIVGGVVARVGSTVFDGSVTNHLQKMRQRLAESV